MKRIIPFLLLIALAFSFASCGKVEPLDLANTDLSGYVTLGDYLGVTVEMDAKKEATDADVKAVADKLLESKATKEKLDITDRAVADGDTVNIDYTGYIDDVAFEGGSAQGQNLVIGSGQFVEGFESGLIGAEIGATVSVSATFPNPYELNPDLAGKTARFDVKVNSISVENTILPEYTDTFVADNTEFDTIADYEADIRADLEAENEAAFKSNKISAVWYAIINDATFTELPKQNVEYELKKLKDNIEYNKTLFMYYYGLDEKTVESLFKYEEADLLADAEKAVKEDLVFNAIVKAEGYAISEEEYQKALSEYAAANETDTAKLEASYSKEVLTEAFLWDKVLQTLADSANIVNK